MPKSDEIVAKEAQRQQSRRATLDILKSKKRAEKELTFKILTDDGEQNVSFLLRAISNAEYDKLLTANPPTLEQKVEGLTYNTDTFPPHLLSKVVADPEMTKQEWVELWNSAEWSRGEMQNLFGEAVILCNQSLVEVDPTAAV